MSVKLVLVLIRLSVGCHIRFVVVVNTKLSHLFVLNTHLLFV
jgi:hypothetical protein